MSFLVITFCLAAQPAAASAPHWAFQPVTPQEVPEVENAAWAKDPLDRFILAKLEARGLQPSPPAERATLLKRVYYDLIGLPPSYDEVRAFVADPAPDAFSRVVDRLLASPHYGERWGRHWLDVARYADTKDLVLVLGQDAVRPYAYTYRDYVIRALNADTPYDRFVHEQLAADQLYVSAAGDGPASKESWRLGAMGFLTLGRLFCNNPHDIFDDQIDTVTRGLLALTVSCARCHDHKYDPIPTADYYSLYGVFASSERPIERPYIAAPGDTPGGEAFEREAAPLREKLAQHIDAQYREINETALERLSEYFERIATTPPDPLESAVFFMSLSPEQLRPVLVARWRRYLGGVSRDDPVFGPWVELLSLAEEELAERAPGIAARWRSVPSGTGSGELNPIVGAALSTADFSDRASVARFYGELLTRARPPQEDAGAPAPASDPAWKQLQAVIAGKKSPLYFPKSMTYLHMSRVPRGEYHQLLLDIDKLAVKSSGAPPRAMVLVDAAELHDPRVFVRGDALQPGASVPRRFLEVLSPPERQPFRHGSGRLDLARAITAPENPLTGRVLVNRVWMHHLGEPLVDTPSDFGLRSAPPSHPGLLDHLTTTLVRTGWSLKELHRRILSSATYQQASRDRPACRALDAGNRLLWRAHRRRLELEPLRDALLAISGRLDPTLYGRPLDVARDPLCRRRTVYGLVDRQDVPSLFRAFDFANPDQSIARRPQTTVPQQALYGMNAPFVIEQAKALAARAEVRGAAPGEARVQALYRRVFARDPSREETSRALRFVAASAADAGRNGNALGPWEEYAHVLLLTNEVVFVE